MRRRAVTESEQIFNIIEAKVVNEYGEPTTKKKDKSAGMATDVPVPVSR